MESVVWCGDGVGVGEFGRSGAWWRLGWVGAVKTRQRHRSQKQHSCPVPRSLQLLKPAKTKPFRQSQAN
ncbi:hypothetical protein BAUCODRAFT_32489 [Baudoinia panamericana UAMH 10762]|uniref:Uncharacterized protein n=1 Tax=Baudoinia panamericana (strain UAMH 10762) TaxID=717646 RepID=M2NHE7_BAUPA|nr:uncharacterized protein BAUCODRAFT_32489 [Baudoinia panamericana UAMH 10762]EMC98450.1 hypothetical protein BAUCODRAFT_32489 [Baudoinia panamericana UAMH 10762]